MTTLTDLGWSPFFQQQLSLDEFEHCRPARVLAQHRSVLRLGGEAGEFDLDILPGMPAVTTGDWLLLGERGQFLRLLDRVSLFSRKAAGTGVQEQLIAANVDTVLLVMSSNEDFNLSRLERYLALVHEAGAEAVILLTKADISDEVETHVGQIRELDPMLVVEAVDARNPETAERLRPWLRSGKTLLVLGSSGVGKSTLVNTLLGGEVQATSAIREDDSKGRHTTTGRSLHRLPGGGLLLDTPGMRELQLANVSEGLEKTFGDITDLATRCRFHDCAHQSEPGCAVQAALAEGALSERRLHNYRKLLREQAINSATLAEQRSRNRARGKMYRSILAQARRLKGDH